MPSEPMGTKPLGPWKMWQSPPEPTPGPARPALPGKFRGCSPGLSVIQQPPLKLSLGRVLLRTTCPGTLRPGVLRRDELSLPQSNVGVGVKRSTRPSPKQDSVMRLGCSRGSSGASWARHDTPEWKLLDSFLVGSQRLDGTSLPIISTLSSGPLLGTRPVPRLPDGLLECDGATLGDGPGAPIGSPVIGLISCRLIRSLICLCSCMGRLETSSRWPPATPMVGRYWPKAMVQQGSEAALPKATKSRRQ